METQLNWLHAAENDYKTVIELLKFNDSNAIGYITQQAIEKYAKHILCKAHNIEPQDINKLTYKTTNSFNQKQYKTFGHNIHAMFSELQRRFDIQASENLRTHVKKIESLYYNVRYPDTANYHNITSDEIALCKKGLQLMRAWCYEKEAEIELNQEMEDISLD